MTCARVKIEWRDVEDPVREEAQQIWKSVKFWHSENFIVRVAKTIHPEIPHQQLYVAAAQASACVRQARSYIKNNARVDPFIQPLLAYYALLNWYKALLHLFDLSYPASTSVLQHGVSVRRTKRVAYRLPTESVYIYKEGVLQSAASLAGLSLPPRIKLGDMLGFLPEMQDLIATVYPSCRHLFSIMHQPNVDSRNEDVVFVDRRAPAGRGLTVHEWLREFEKACPVSDSSKTPPSDNQTAATGQSPSNVDSESPSGWLRLPHFDTNHPWVVQQSDKLWIADSTPPPEWVLHFVTLYCLSSVVRYNPLEWSDIERWHNESDALIVEAYAEQSSEFVDRAAHNLFLALHSRITVNATKHPSDGGVTDP